MKKALLILLFGAALVSCKQEQKTDVPSEVAGQETEVVTEEKKNHKIKSITRRDYFAKNEFGEYIQGKQINNVIRRYNEDGLPYEIEIGILDASQAKVAGDTLSKDSKNSNVFVYSPKKNGDNVEMYTKDGELAEILVMKNNMMIGYEAGNETEPFAIRKFDEIGNYEYQVIIPEGDDHVYATVHDIVEKDENGFAKKSNAVWMQLKKRDDIDYNNLDISKLEVVSKSYQVVEFDYEVYE